MADLNITERALANAPPGTIVRSLIIFLNSFAPAIYPWVFAGISMIAEAASVLRLIS